MRLERDIIIDVNVADQIVPEWVPAIVCTSPREPDGSFICATSAGRVTRHTGDQCISWRFRASDGKERG